MTTDWILVRRMAAELEQAFGGARVTDVGLLDDGRTGVRFARARTAPTLAIDPFGSPPAALPVDAAPGLRDPGWLRAASTALRGTKLLRVESRHGDRVLVLTFGSASRFGVTSEFRLVAELVPRYGNVVVLRDRLVVAAAKQFSPAENEARSVQVGLPYEPPPLPRNADGGTPQIPRALADAAAADPGTDAAALLAEAERNAADAHRPVHVYRDADGTIVAAHVVPLAQHAGLAHATAASLLDVLAEARGSAQRTGTSDATERRRAVLLARIAKRARANAGELEATSRRFADSADRERLRRSGDALFTHAHEIAAGATAFVPPTDPEITVALDPDLDAKANAQAYYARYRKAAAALPHLERRARMLEARRDALEELAFEAERGDAAALAEVAAELDALEGRPPQSAAAGAPRKREPLRLERPSGARIYVGRSPRENAEVTFRIARPDDLWFHARGIPGSHVVLQAPPGRAAADDDLDAAADLAATHSKARNAPRVEVDYTERKYVRKQRDAAAGLVWYTNARTRVGRPSAT
jgi:predicted ribosome quality control (RQC) complex YloA/Tae2 family protein